MVDVLCRETGVGRAVAEEVAAAELMLRRIKWTEREMLTALANKAGLVDELLRLSRYERRARSRLRRASTTLRLFQIGGGY